MLGSRLNITKFNIEFKNNHDCFTELTPRIIQPLKALNVLEGENFELVVTYTPRDKIPKWYLNNQVLEDNDNFAITTQHGASRLQVYNANKKKVGKYEVIVENDNILAKTACSVKLTKNIEENTVLPPVFVRALQPNKVSLGTIVLLETEVVSNPCASFQWFIDTNEINSLIKQNKLSNVYVSHNENVSCLCIENISKDLIGVVTCRAENFAGSVSTSGSLILEEQTCIDGDAPLVLAPLETTTVMDGERISLNCKILGRPWPKIDWFHNEKLIETARDITISRQKSGLCEIHIKEAFPEMAGIYKCTASNQFGKCSTECILNIEGSRINFYYLYICMLS